MANMNVPLPKSVFERDYAEKRRVYVEDLVGIGKSAESRLFDIAERCDEEEWQWEWDFIGRQGQGNFGELTVLPTNK